MMRNNGLALPAAVWMIRHLHPIQQRKFLDGSVRLLRERGRMPSADGANRTHIARSAFDQFAVCGAYVRSVGGRMERTDCRACIRVARRAGVWVNNDTGAPLTYPADHPRSPGKAIIGANADGPLDLWWHRDGALWITGANGTGKTMTARNIARSSLEAGSRVDVVSAREPALREYDDLGANTHEPQYLDSVIDHDDTYLDEVVIVEDADSVFAQPASASLLESLVDKALSSATFHLVLVGSDGAWVPGEVKDRLATALMGKASNQQRFSVLRRHNTVPSPAPWRGCGVLETRQGVQAFRSYFVPVDNG